MQTNPQEYVQQMNRIIAEVKKAVVGKDVLIAKILLAATQPLAIPTAFFR